MRQTIELLRKQSIQAGLTTAHMQSMGVKNQNQQLNAPNTLQNNAQIKNTSNSEQLSRLPPSSNESTLQRHLSSDSMCSLNSISSGCSTQDKKKKKGWVCRKNHINFPLLFLKTLNQRRSISFNRMGQFTKLVPLRSKSNRFTRFNVVSFVLN